MWLFYGRQVRKKDTAFTFPVSAWFGSGKRLGVQIRESSPCPRWRIQNTLRLIIENSLVEFSRFNQVSIIGLQVMQYVFFAAWLAVWQSCRNWYLYKFTQMLHNAKTNARKNIPRAANFQILWQRWEHVMPNRCTELA